MKKFQTELFAVALEKARADKYAVLLENKKKQAKTNGYNKRPKFDTHRSIAHETGVNEATVRNVFVGKYTAGIEPLKALADWANIKTDNFFK